jgi:hypothetical protein
MSLWSRAKNQVMGWCLRHLWKSPERVAQTLLRFSSTEIDSAWQNIHALNHGVSDPALRAQMLDHILEELHHASMLKNLSKRYSKQSAWLPLLERDPIYKGESPEKALENFFVYEAVGEHAVEKQFETYASASPYQDVRALFLRLLED